MPFNYRQIELRPLATAREEASTKRIMQEQARLNRLTEERAADRAEEAAKKADRSKKEAKLRDLELGMVSKGLQIPDWQARPRGAGISWESPKGEERIRILEEILKQETHEAPIRGYQEEMATWGGEARGEIPITPEGRKAGIEKARFEYQQKVAEDKKAKEEQKSLDIILAGAQELLGQSFTYNGWVYTIDTPEEMIEWLSKEYTLTPESKRRIHMLGWAEFRKKYKTSGVIGPERPISRDEGGRPFATKTGAPIVYGPGGRPITGTAGEVMPGTEYPSERELMAGTKQVTGAQAELLKPKRTEEEEIKYQAKLAEGKRAEGKVSIQERALVAVQSGKPLPGLTMAETKQLARISVTDTDIDELEAFMGKYK